MPRGYQPPRSAVQATHRCVVLSDTRQHSQRSSIVTRGHVPRQVKTSSPETSGEELGFVQIAAPGCVEIVTPECMVPKRAVDNVACIVKIAPLFKGLWITHSDCDSAAGRCQHQSWMQTIPAKASNIYAMCSLIRLISPSQLPACVTCVAPAALAVSRNKKMQRSTPSQVQPSQPPCSA